jgi:hypothetical protein
MKQDQLFSQIYQIDEATNLYMIEVALDQYGDIFNEWDPAPFKRREIDPDLELYLEGSSDEISDRYPIELSFTLPQGTRDEQTEQEMRDGLRNSFTFKIYLLKKELRKTNAQMLRWVLLGFIFLWLGSVLSSQFKETVLVSLLAEGLFIGGWVFLWEAVSLFFFTNRELYNRYRTYRRLHQAPVFFREAEPSQPHHD